MTEGCDIVAADEQVVAFLAWRELAAVVLTRACFPNFPATALHATCALKRYFASIMVVLFAVTAASMTDWVAYLADVAASTLLHLLGLMGWGTSKSPAEEQM